jgi:hypothetical protein
LKVVDYFWSRGSLCGRTCRRISHGALAIALLSVKEIAISVNGDFIREIGLNVIEVDAVVLWHGDGAVVVISARNVIGIKHESSLDHVFETILEVAIAGRRLDDHHFVYQMTSCSTRTQYRL